ncbi:TIGR02452 family protein [Deinococcus arcticus]|uniref:TIGR02452 family protein n=1 Tax=Deinococcus arcticus TaxID=2136176 RepID=A0A2T3WAB0_9DEIO|nr:TIGR02452 family protein [Deinococcus arcticus]PTA68839.1 TIGR02452 family protein [Deinococcus arcticus]
MTTHAARVQLAQETLKFLRQGWYPAGGAQVPLPDLRPMLDGTRLLTPADGPALLKALRATQGRCVTRTEVTPETTFAAARRLRAHGAEVLALNFASALKPGGGFLKGSLSQEEDLCRCSALHLSLTAPQVWGYYAANREEGSALYTDHLIYSPQVPVFRDDESALLPHPVTVNVLTAPAPNAGAVAVGEPERRAEVAGVLRRRAARVLGAAAQTGQTHLVLGAWGCGVFLNNPVTVAALFRELLATEAAGVFEHVTFAVYDRQAGQPVLQAFQRALGTP